MPNQFVPPGEINETVIVDVFGRPVLTIRYTKFIITLANKSVAELTRGDNFLLVDGTVWSPAFLNGPNSVRLGVCHLCRYPPFRLFRRETPTHGLCALHNIRLCVCGISLCPNHRALCSDGKWRCARCANRNRLGNFLWTIVSREED